MNKPEKLIAVVTGASRGAGRGIAAALGAAGATVYITGRTLSKNESELPGTLDRTARQIAEAGGTGIPVICDHSDDSAVEALFDRVAKESGRLDILVNNATHLPGELTAPGAFWSKPLNLVDIMDVGLRSHYVASWYAAPLLLNGGGLVVNTSSYGGTCYMHGPAYGAGKAAVDKLAHDMAHDFRPYDVAVVSIWMGLLLTERTKEAFEEHPELYQGLAESAETPEYIGHVVHALLNDSERMSKSGKILIAAELGAEYGLVDAGNLVPKSHREILGSPTEYSDAVVE